MVFWRQVRSADIKCKLKNFSKSKQKLRLAIVNHKSYNNSLKDEIQSNPAAQVEARRAQIRV